MFIATPILILAIALFFFNLQETCRRIVGKPFDRDYSNPIVRANRLEFLSVRRAAEDIEAPLEYGRFRAALECDYLTLTYLLKKVANESRRHSRNDRLLMAYFRVTAISVSLRHLARLGERAAMLRMTRILEYFSNVVGQRANLAKPGDLTATEYLMTLK